MGDARRDEDEGSLAGNYLLVVDCEDELAFEDVEGIVLRTMSMQLGAVAVRLDGYDREVESRCIRASRQELDVSDTPAFAGSHYDRALRRHGARS